MRSANAPRIVHDATVQLEGGSAARAVNLSTGGIYLVAQEALEPGAAVQLTVSLRDGGQPLDARGEVVWRADGGMGLRWVALDEVGRRRIQRLVERNQPTSFARRDVRIRLPSLSTPLRASARDLTERGILIEAELPWLQLGAPVTAELSPDRACAGKMQWIGLDANQDGAARLRMFVNLSNQEEPPRAFGRVDQAGTIAALLPWLLRALAVGGWVASLALGFALWRHPQPAVLPSVELEDRIVREPASMSIPKTQVAEEPKTSVVLAPAVKTRAAKAPAAKRVVAAPKRAPARKPVRPKRRAG